MTVWTYYGLHRNSPAWQPLAAWSYEPSLDEQTEVRLRYPQYYDYALSGRPARQESK